MGLQAAVYFHPMLMDHTVLMHNLEQIQRTGISVLVCPSFCLYLPLPNECKCARHTCSIFCTKLLPTSTDLRRLP